MSGFPQPHSPSTVSHWIATNRGPESLDLHGAKDELPAQADYVIVGGGMSGAALAYFLTRPGAAGEGKSVILIEAKEVASGATGRNGGHLCAGHFHAYPALIAPLPSGAGCTPHEAVEVLESEVDNYRSNIALIKEHNLDVDLWTGDLIDVYPTLEEKEARRQARADWLAARAQFGLQDKDTGMQWIEEPEEAKKLSRCFWAEGAGTRPAGSVHPHKLTTALLKLALASTTSKFSLFTSTYLKTFTPNTTDPKSWDIETSRGSLHTPNLILCTNAHTPKLFPSSSSPLATHIYPVRGQASLITPTTSFSGKQALSYTYGLGGAAPYLVTTKGGGLLLGCGTAGFVNSGLAKKEEFYNQTDDSALIPGATQYLEEYCKNNFTSWGEEAPGEGLTRTWTGIMGYSRDILPLVGNYQGINLCVGFHGHGMSRILVCARGLAHQLATGEWDSRLPRKFDPTEERLQRMKSFTDEGEELTK